MAIFSRTGVLWRLQKLDGSADNGKFAFIIKDHFCLFLIITFGFGMNIPEPCFLNAFL
jgi:hypothetical protein